MAGKFAFVLPAFLSHAQKYKTKSIPHSLTHIKKYRYCNFLLTVPGQYFLGILILFRRKNTRTPLKGKETDFNRFYFVLIQNKKYKQKSETQ
jgi:hypothetical protein